MQREKYIRASDIGTHAFCPRALHLKDPDAPSSLDQAQRAGIDWHVNHARTIQHARQTSLRVAMLLVVGIVLLALAVALR